ncbi:unnamed protein product, partial [Heterosigma akashiwo]
RPQSPAQARRLPDWPEWEAALHGELASLDKKNSCTLTDLPSGANVIGTRWVL